MSDVLQWLQGWYHQQCDGDWEHQNGISVQTLDNPGWRVTINLEDTTLEERSFTTVEWENNVADWGRCWVTDGVFHGAGGPLTLIPLLTVFRQWVADDQIP